MKIKICGLTNPENANEIVALQPDFIGCIFTSISKRKIDIEQAKKINHPKKIGVFVNQSISEITSTLKQIKLFAIQLHGNETITFCNEIKQHFPNIKIIKAFSISTQKDTIEIQNYSKVVDYFLFDTKGENYGGNGISFDWEILNQIEINKPYFLSGGIELENLKNIKKLKQKPFAIDANSKLEDVVGIKNIVKTQKLIQYVQTI